MAQIGPTAGTQLKNIAVAQNSSGVPGIAYVDFSSGTVTTGKLKFAVRSSASASGTWTSYLVPGTTSPQFPSLDFDHLNRPWIGYFDATVNKFYLVTNTSSNGSGTWLQYESPIVPSGAPAALPRANNTGVGIFYNGGVAHPVLVFIDNNAVSFGLKAVTLNNTTRAWGVSSTIDALTATGAAHLSVASDATYGVVIAFQDLTVTQVKYAYMTGMNTWSATYGFSGVNRGQGVDIRIDSSGRPSVSYFDSTNNAVYVSKCSGTLSSCISGGWSSQQVETSAGVSGLTAATGQLLSTAHVYDGSGYTYPIYPRGAGNDGNLIMSGNPTGSYVAGIAMSGASAGLSTATPALSYGQAGWGLSAVRNSSGLTTIAHQGPGNWLYATSCTY